jgi:hypothetical protein
MMGGGQNNLNVLSLPTESGFNSLADHEALIAAWFQQIQPLSYLLPSSLVLQNIQ